LTYITPHFDCRRMVHDYMTELYEPAHEQHVRLRNDYGLVREKAHWNAKVREVWDRVKFVDPGTGPVGSVTSGNPFEVRAAIDLAGLTPDDVRVEILEDKRARIELSSLELGKPFSLLGCVWPARAGRVAEEVIVSPRALDDRPRSRRTDEVADPALLAGPKVDHPAPSRVPWRAPRKFDIDVVLIRKERTEYAENIELSGRGRGRVSLALLVRSERPLVRMGTRVNVRDMRHRGVAEDHRAVTSDDVAPVQTLANEERIGVRPVVVGGVQLVEPVVVSRENQRCAANADVATRCRDPEAGVVVADQKFRARRGRCDSGGVRSGTGRGGADDRGDESNGNRATTGDTHRGKYSA